MLQAKLKVVGGRHHGRVIPLATKKFLIGREQDCHLRPNSELVSRHHCVFAVDDFSVHVRDLGSTNGTFVNDQRVRGEVLLNSGDRIRVGKLDFELVIGEPVTAAAANKNGDSSQLLPGLSTVASAAETGAARRDGHLFRDSRSRGARRYRFEHHCRVGDPRAGRASAPTRGGRCCQSRYGRFHSHLVTAGFARILAGNVPFHGNALSTGSLPAGVSLWRASDGVPTAIPVSANADELSGDVSSDGTPDGYVSAVAPSYAPPASQPAALPEPEPENEDTGSSIQNVRLPDPKTTGAKAPPPAPQPAPAPQAAAPPAGEENPLGAAAKSEEQKQSTTS